MDHAALLLLRKLVDDVEHGRAQIVGVAATGDELSVKWQASTPPASALAPTAPAPAARANIIEAGDLCPRCQSQPVRDISGSLMCSSCGTVG